MASPRSRICLVTALRLQGFTSLVERSVPGKVRRLVSVVHQLLREDEWLAAKMEATFGQCLKAYRLAVGMTRAALASCGD